MQLVAVLKWCYSSWKLVEDGLFRILTLRREGLSYGKSAKALKEEGHNVTKAGVH